MFYQDLPNALYDVDAQDEKLAWPIFVVGCFVLTYICLNLLLAICCTVFYDIHTALDDAQEARESAIAIQVRVQLIGHARNNM